jgi:hypothetical protein
VVVTVPGVVPISAAEAPPALVWVVTTDDIEAFSPDGDPLEGVPAGVWLVLLEEADGWLLVAADPELPFWIAYDDRVEVTSDQPS